MSKQKPNPSINTGASDNAAGALGHWGQTTVYPTEEWTLLCLAWNLKRRAS